MLPDNSPEPKAPTRRSTRVPPPPKPKAPAPALAPPKKKDAPKKKPTATAVKKAVAVKKADKAKTPKSTTKATATKATKKSAATTKSKTTKAAATTKKASSKTAPKAVIKASAKATASKIAPKKAVTPKSKAPKKEEAKEEAKKEETKEEVKEEKKEEKEVKPSTSGKKRAADAAESTVPTKRGKGSSVKKEEASDTPSLGLKLTIERCNTCTQYKTNVNRLRTVANKLYPGTEVEDEMIPNSKKFEIYLGRDGDKGRLIWSGHSRAPPKRLAFPDSGVFTDLLKAELEE
ncbi:hypothetical protein BG000_010815 [Podila horticola]|nr:hypothetical protein BG000_010815 [Podila horticola]